jgi:hypothetical protein
MNVCCDFWSVSYFIIDELILLFVTFIELLGHVYAFFCYL